MKAKTTWDAEDEKAWRELAKRRENNKSKLGIMHMCRSLRDLADRMESGDSKNFENVKIEYLYHDAFGYERGLPYAREITLTVALEDF